MKWIRSNFVLKLAAFLLALVVGTGGFWASTFILYQWDTLWLSSGYYDSVDYHADLYNRLNQLQEMARLLQVKEWDGSLPYLDQRRLDTLEESLSPEHTNFRYTIRRNEGGTLISSNLEGAATLDGSVHTVEQSEMSVGNDSPTEADYMVWNGEERYYLVYVTLPDGTKQLFTPENANEAYQYGYTFNGIEWDYDSDLDSRVNRAMLALEYGVTDPLTVQDEFWTGSQDYFQYASYLPALAVLALVLDLVGVLLVIFLCRTAGWRKGENRPVQGWFDRIPLDLLAVGEFFAVALLLNAGDVMAYGLNVSHMAPDLVAGLGMVTAAILACLLAFCLTVAVRIKTRTLWSCTLVWMLCRLIARGCRAAARSWPFTWRVVALFLLYLLGTILTGLTIFLIPFYQGAVLYAICRWTIQWKRVRTGTEQITGGNPEYKIDTEKMYRDLKIHAEQLNNLGSAISTAVDERMKSERFKAELITNVSHDLKTPLTSIINYADLIGKEPPNSEKIPEYAAVLTRQSERLKRLIEDLVEASKASTGNLEVNLAPCQPGVLLTQAAGEYEQKLKDAGLDLVTRQPETAVTILADGRRLWRVFDNLMNNICKYAQRGTRVYLTLEERDGQAVISFKNTSRAPLDIPAEELLERFVRGDAARGGEGNGLGLSIARSLTELQKGTLELTVDGDLFKVVLRFSELS